MKSFIFAAYQCSLSLVLFLFVSIAVAQSDDTRVLFGEIDASIELLSVDVFGTHYFALENHGEGSLYFTGYGKHSPIYSIKLLDESGEWKMQSKGFICGTGLRTVDIKPGQAVFFEARGNGEDLKVGVNVRTDEEDMVNSAMIWSVDVAAK